MTASPHDYHPNELYFTLSKQRHDIVVLWNKSLHLSSIATTGAVTIRQQSSQFYQDQRALYIKG